jgi:hypothetical protein
MGIDAIYPAELEPLYPAATEAYLQDLPPVDTHTTVVDYGTKRPPEAIAQILDLVTAAARRIETDRRLIAYNGAVLKGMLEQFPDLVAKLPEEKQAQVKDAASRISAEQPESS